MSPTQSVPTDPLIVPNLIPLWPVEVSKIVKNVPPHTYNKVVDGMVSIENGIPSSVGWQVGGTTWVLTNSVPPLLCRVNGYFVQLELVPTHRDNGSTYVKDSVIIPALMEGLTLTLALVLPLLENIFINGVVRERMSDMKAATGSGPGDRERPEGIGRLRSLCR